MTSARVAGVVAWLFLLQALIFGAVANASPAFSFGEAGAAVAATGELCDARFDDRRAPPHSSRHCEQCVLCQRGHAPAPSAVLVAQAVAVPALRLDVAATWVFARRPEPIRLGSTGSWSSRAPPAA